MKVFQIILLILLSASWVSCSDNDGGATTVDSVLNADSTTVNKASTALGSIATLASSSSIGILAGTANSHCTATGGPKDNSGADMDRSADNGTQGAIGYCQATFNSVSPDTVRGSMAIGGGILCEAGRSGAFVGVNDPGDTNSVTADVNIDTTCWGSAEDVAALTADMGTSIIPDMDFTVTEVTNDTAYNFKIDYSTTGISGSIYVYRSGTVSAALSSDGWAFEMDSSTGTIRFEGIDSTNSRRNRLLVEGTLSSDGIYSAVTSISGFQVQSGDLSTYNGDLNGLIGDFYTSGVDRTDECFIQTTATPNCGATTSLAVGGDGDAAATALAGSLATRNSNLTAFTSSRLNFTTIDTADFDLTD